MEDAPEDTSGKKTITLVITGVDPAARFLWNCARKTFPQPSGELMNAMLRDLAAEVFGEGHAQFMEEEWNRTQARKEQDKLAEKANKGPENEPI